MMSRKKFFCRLSAAVLMASISGSIARAQNAVPFEPGVAAGVDLNFAIQNAPAEQEWHQQLARMRQSARERLIGHLETHLDWVAEIAGLSEGQRQEAKRVAHDIARHSAAASQSVGGEQLPPAFAHRTSMATLARLQFHEELRQSVLTPEQSTRLDAALRERIAIHRRAFRDLTIATLDRELFFTGEQRAALRERMAATSSRFDAPPPNFSSNGEASSAFEMPDSLPEGFSPELREIWQSICRESGGVHILPEEIPQRLDAEQRLRQRRDVLLKSAELQIAFYQQAARLGPEKVDSLRLAAKKLAMEYGAKQSEENPGERVLLQKIEGLVEMAVIVEDDQGMILGGGSHADLLRSDSGWQAAIEQALADAPREALEARDQFLRAAQVDAVVAMLDEELWLREGQRQAIRELVSLHLPNSLDSYSAYFHMRNGGWCAHVIKGHGAEPPACLNEQQKTLWQALEKSYTPDNDPRQFLPIQAINIQVLEEEKRPFPIFFGQQELAQPVDEKAPDSTNIEVRETRPR